MMSRLIFIALLFLTGCSSLHTEIDAPASSIRSVAISRAATVKAYHSDNEVVYTTMAAQNGVVAAVAGQALISACVPNRVRSAFAQLSAETAESLPSAFYDAVKSAGLFPNGVSFSDEPTSGSADAEVRLTVPQAGFGRRTPWSNEGFVWIICKAELVRKGQVLSAWSAEVRDPTEIGRVNFDQFNSDHEFARRVGISCARLAAEKLVTEFRQSLNAKGGRPTVQDKISRSNLP